MEEMQFDQTDVQNTKGLSCLSYLGILFLIPLLVNKESPYTKFHVNQGIVLFITEIVLGIVSVILSIVLAFVPGIGPLLSSLVSMAVGLIGLIFVILGIVNAAQGKAKALPVIGSIRILK